MADIAILLERNLQEIFGEGDDALRQKASEEIKHEDAAFVEPHGIYPWERGDRSPRRHHQGRVRHPPVGARISSSCVTARLPPSTSVSMANPIRPEHLFQTNVW